MQSAAPSTTQATTQATTPAQITHELAEFPIVIDIRVAWGDMDAFQHVNNVAYFRYFESARIAYFEQLADFQLGSGVGPILAATECKYIRPVVYPDTLLVGARITEVDTYRLMMEYKIVSQKQNALVTLGKGTVVTFNHHTQQKVPVSESLKAQIQQLEATKNRI